LVLSQLGAPGGSQHAISRRPITQNGLGTLGALQSVRTRYCAGLRVAAPSALKLSDNLVLMQDALRAFCQVALGCSKAV
jgi:hypothetical protein